MKGKYIFLSVVIGTGILYLTGCRSASVTNRTEASATSNTDAAILEDAETENVQADIEDVEADTDLLTGKSTLLTEESRDGGVKGAEQEAPENEADDMAKEDKSEEDMPKEAPQLPGTGRQLEDFVPKGWQIRDSVELDFNEDGITDYVGVLEEELVDMDGYWSYQGYPRILFAIAGDKTDGYRLDFQDNNLIRTREEGGVFGDPYLPLTAEGNSFTTHTYGGSAWRWSEDNTYTYRDGTWWLTSSEETYGYGEYTTSYSKDDWESGIGIRKQRSSDFDDMEKNWEQAEYNDVENTWEETEYDVEYELSLDKPVTLEQAGKRWWLAPDRVTDWEIETVTFAADVELSEDMVKLPEEAYIDYCDEDCVLYTFSSDADIEKGFYCVAMYRWQDKALSILAKEEAEIDSPKVYDGKIYYTTEIVENVTYKMMQDGKEQITEEEDAVGIRLNRMKPDGTGKETVFEYRYREAGREQEIRESRIPYLSLIYEISGNEIVVEVYIGNEPHPIYRMNTDGSERKRIGQVPKEAA